MNKPIERGCLAEVIGGALGEASPNKGLVVKVLTYVADDPTFGRIWRCEAEFATAYADIPGATPKTLPPRDGTLAFAQDWLRRLPDPPQATTATTINAPDEVTA